MTEMITYEVYDFRVPGLFSTHYLAHATFAKVY